MNSVTQTLTLKSFQGVAFRRNAAGQWVITYNGSQYTVTASTDLIIGSTTYHINSGVSDAGNDIFIVNDFTKPIKAGAGRDFIDLTVGPVTNPGTVLTVDGGAGIDQVRINAYTYNFWINSGNGSLHAVWGESHSRQTLSADFWNVEYFWMNNRQYYFEKMTGTSIDKSNAVLQQLIVGAGTSLDVKASQFGDLIFVHPTSTASITGGKGNDYIVTGDSNDTVIAGAGDDSIFAGGGLDMLCGNAGNDYIELVQNFIPNPDVVPTLVIGGDGSDTIKISGRGVSWLWGDGYGKYSSGKKFHDDFFFDCSLPAFHLEITIMDFDAGTVQTGNSNIINDKIYLSGGLKFSDLTITERTYSSNSPYARVSYENANSSHWLRIDFQGLTANRITPDLFGTF